MAIISVTAFLVWFGRAEEKRHGNAAFKILRQVRWFI